MNELLSTVLKRSRNGIRMAYPGRLGRPITVLILASMAGGAGAVWAPPQSCSLGHGGCTHRHQENFDVRHKPDTAPQSVRSRIGTGAASSKALQDLAEGRRALEAAIPGVKLTPDEILGGPMKLTGRRGFLTSETKKLAPDTLVRNFVSQHAPAFGLRQDRLDDQVITDASYETLNNKQNWVRLTQKVGGIPVFGGELTALVTETGQIASLVNGMAPALEEKSVLANTVTLTPEDAAFVAAAEVNIDLGTDELVREATSEDNRPITFQALSPMRAIQAEQIIFPLGPGNAVIGWLVTLTAKEGGHSVIIHATDGSVLFRKNLVAHQTPVATQDVTLEYYLGDSPAPYTPYPHGPVPYLSDVPQHAATIPIGRTTTNTISGLLPIEVNRRGWVEDFSDISRGNNVYAYRDQTPGDGVDTNPGNGQLSAAYGHGAGPSLYNRNFLYSFVPAPGGFDGPTGSPFSSSPYDNGSVTNMFVWTNLYHDIMYRYGFTEGARNFQEQNFGRGALGNDAVLAEAQDWSGTNNANFLTPPDGVQGVMQMYAFPDIERDSLQDGWQPSRLESTPRARDSALDQQVLIHELTHGLSNRLIGNGLGLVNQQGGGMGEGWSDFYALSILSDIPEDNDPDKVYPMGGWLTYDMMCAMHDNYFYGIRRFPYSTNLMINPLTLTHTSFQSYYPGWGGSGYYASPDRSLYPESPLCRGAFGGITHNVGEIWCSALWQARSNVMRDFEKTVTPTPAATTHAVLQRGNEHMLQLVTDGMKLTPPSPTFLDARDAIFEAALAQTSNPPDFTSHDQVNPDIGQLDEIALWRGFATRGFGLSAIAPPRTDGFGGNIDQNYYRLDHGPICQRGYFPPARRVAHIPALTDDKAYKFDLRGRFTFYGQSYTKMYVSENGYLTFGTPLTIDENADGSPATSLSHHFSQPRITALMKDLDPKTGQIRIFESSDVCPDRVYIIWDRVEDKGGNPNTFAIEIPYDTIPGCNVANPLAGVVRISYLDMSTTDGIVGLSRGGTPFNFEEYDLSESIRCDMNPRIPETWTEEFDGDFDLSGRRASPDGPELVQTFVWTPAYAEGFSQPAVEAYDVPLKIAEPILRAPDSDTRVPALEPGQTVALSVPLGNEFVRANLSNVIGLLTPITGGINVVNPVATYGTLVAGGTAEGTPFLIEVGDASEVLCGSDIQMKIDFTNDQMVTGSRVISLRVGEVINQETTHNFRFPQEEQRTNAIVLGSAPDALQGETTQIFLKSGNALKTGVRLRNQTTGEIVEVEEYSAFVQPLQFTVRRGINGVTEVMNDGDTLEFDSIPIPDANTFGITTPIVSSGVVGEFGPNSTVGNVKVTIHEIRHARLGDLTARLTSPDNRVSVLLFDQLRNESGLSAVGDVREITFDDAAGVNIQTQGEPVSGNSYQPADRTNSVSGLRAFRDGQVPANGEWKLTVSDGFAPLAGEMVSWSISLAPKIVATCVPTQSVMQSSLSQSIEGWVGYGAGDQNALNFGYNSGAPATLSLTTYPSPQARVPAWQSPGVNLVNIPNHVYRFSAWVFRSGQQNPSDQSQIPNMRIRSQVRFAMSNMTEYFFDPTQFDPDTNDAMLAIAPSTDSARPTHYFVDFDPVDVPALYGDPVEQVKGTVENFSIYPNEHGSLEITEARIERYAAPADDEGTLLRTYGPQDFEVNHIGRGNMANPEIFADGPFARPTASVAPHGVTLDSSNVGNEGTSFVSFDFVAQDGNDPIMKAGKMYRVRFHVSSDTASENNPQFRLRSRTIKWSYSNVYEVGSAKAAGAGNNLIAAQALPGIGTQNPNKKSGERNGGYYDLYVHPPTVLPPNPALRRLRFGFDLIDGVFGAPTPEQIGVSGRFTFDSIEVREFNAR